MKYLQTVRTVHLWLGLIISLFLLTEAFTGLILSRPALIGAGKATHSQHSQLLTGEVKSPAGLNQNLTEEEARTAAEQAKLVSGDVSSLVFLKQLHQGIIYNNTFRWLVELVAVSIIILTLTGIYLSVPFLKVQFTKNSLVKNAVDKRPL
ncbi:PepSY domain-containing protein|uniref:PepSY-associated TM region n=1 Tax=Dendrosporobacter quercicolus TaxID=146817 RepID=A0A1G9NG41_9FIRM|nr:PepSY-associated TM helix domain-containing protein [Dendrosporobacter quercicolus]NSL47328.1 PepSY domain-containing protein [Dendrosporobacter quercicolus DSM 1736]SDL85439.1 PepSY-associated TM region [Dendrosporobacter quercicolus]